MVKKKSEKSLNELLEEALVKENEQPYEVPGNWEWVKFDAALTNVTSAQKKLKQRKYLEVGNITVVDQGTKLIGGYTNQEDLQYNGELPVIIFGDHTRIVKFIDFSFVQGADGVKVLLPNQIFNPKFMYYFLRNFYIPNMGYRRHFKFVKEASFSLPPLPEQKRIVKKLSSMLGKLKEARELIQEARDTFEERRAAILNKAFTGELTKKWRDENPDVESARKLIEILIDKRKKQGKEGKKEKIPTYEEMIIEKSDHPYEVPWNWEFVRLGKVVQTNPPKYKPEIGDDTLCSFVPMKAVSDKLGIIENIEKKPYVKMKNGYTSFKENDVLFAKITPCMENGKAAIAKNLINGFGYGSTEFFVFRCSTIVDNNFLYYLIRSKFFRDLAEHNMTGTVGQRRVPKNYLNNFKFPLPPLEEQKEIVRILDILLHHEDEARALIDMEEQIDLIEKSILSKAFRGELDTNDTNDEPAIELLKRSLKEKMNK